MTNIKRNMVFLLRYSEKYLKTDMVYLAKGGFWLTTAKAVASLSSFVTSIFFANFLPKETYGLYRFILSYLSILSLPTLYGIDTSLTKSVGQGYKGSLIPIFKVKVKWGLLSGLASLIFAGYYYWQSNNILAICFFLASFFLPIMDPLQLYMAYLNGKHEYAIYTKYYTILRIVVTILLVGTLFLTNNLSLIILSYLTSYTVLYLCFFVITVRKMKSTDEDSSSIISYGKHLSLMNVLGTVAIVLDKLLIFHLVGAMELAGYYLAMMPYKQIQNFINSLNVLALPKFADNKNSNLRATLPKKIIKSYLIVIPIIVSYAIAAPYLFALFYPQYTSVVWMSIIFMLQLIFLPMYLFKTALTAQGEKQKLYILSVSSAIVRIALLIILVPLWGVSGAVTTILISSMFGATGSCWAFYTSK